MEIPYIKQIESVSELLDLVGNSKDYQARMKAMFDQEARINARLDRFKEVGEIEQIKQNAAGLLADAKGVKADADNYSTEVKGEADKDAERILAAAKDKMDELVAREAALAERESKVVVRGVEQDAKEKELEKREQQAEADLDRAAKLARQAQALQDKLTVKLGQLQSIAGE